MGKWLVTVEETYSKTIEIEAEDHDDACDIVSGMEINMEPSDYLADSFQIIECEELKEIEDEDQ